MSQFPDPDIVGYDVFDDLTDDIEPIQKPNKNAQDAANLSMMTTPTPTTTTNTPEKSLKTPPKRKPLRRKSKQKDAVDAAAATTPIKTDAEEQLSGGANAGGDSDAELFEIEESDTPLIPLYHLRDEGTTKWVLLSDLCYLLKVKSKDTLLKLVSVLVTGWN